MRSYFLPSILLLLSSFSHAAGGMPGHGNLHKTSLEHLEWQGANTYELELTGWYGDGLNKLVYTADAHKANQESIEIELDFGWQTAISPFWDSRVLTRFDSDEDDDRMWIGVGFSGTLPYFVHMDTNLLTSKGDTLLDMELLHELPLSQHWSLETRIELTGVTGDESGIEEFSFGLRFGHESLNRFKKYAGVEWQKSPLNNSTRSVLVLGFSYWH